VPFDAFTSGSADPVANQQAQIASQFADLKRRVAALEKIARVQTGSGPPSLAVRDGTMYVDVTNSRLYVRSGSTWKSAALT
jgi:hypothetical protein